MPERPIHRLQRSCSIWAECRSVGASRVSIRPFRLSSPFKLLSPMVLGSCEACLCLDAIEARFPLVSLVSIAWHLFSCRCCMFHVSGLLLYVAILLVCFLEIQADRQSTTLTCYPRGACFQCPSIRLIVVIWFYWLSFPECCAVPMPASQFSCQTT